MAILATDHARLASQVRQRYTDGLIGALPALLGQVGKQARDLLDKPAEHLTVQRRRDLMQGLMKQSKGWHRAMVAGLQQVHQHGGAALQASELSTVIGDPMSLVDNDTIEREILTSRLALAIMDRAGWEFTDLRARVAMLERRGELDTHDMLRGHVLARVVLDAWRSSGLTASDWREAQPILHEQFAALVEEVYHETNRWLIENRVMPEVDLRPYIRRTSEHAQSTGSGSNSRPGAISSTSLMPGAGAPARAVVRQVYAADARGAAAYRHDAAPTGAHRHGLDRPNLSPRQASEHDATVGEETRMMTRAAPLARGSDHAEAVMGRLKRLVGRHLPGFADTSNARPVTDALSSAINQAQQNLRKRFASPDERHRAGGPAPGSPGFATAPTGPMLLEELQAGKNALKQAAGSPAERATIEIVAMMFQSILTEDRIPAAMRVWFARLQMPVLRVAVSEPDFFATLDHPARRLIDRMGACVMGLDSASRAIGDALEKEIKRVVQVVEAYPDTGRRVFQTVLVEFEKFLEHFFKNENEASKRGVSLAQQVEQRETLAILYTIELRKMLNEVPVQEGVRQFLFQVWADVLATSAVRYGGQSDETKVMKRAAADLIWSASAKVTREERAEVIRRLPPLLKRLREGMASANMQQDRQDERISALNSALAAAFSAKAAVISNDRLQDLMERLESLEELLPGSADFEIDESMVLDLSGHESSELEVVSDGGTMPTAPMLAWARELLVGSWYTLEYRNRQEAVQLAWHGMHRQLSMFVTPQGRCVLFQQNRLAAFLQAGLLLPAQDEALTVKATRNALAKLDADPSRLMN